MKRLVQGYDSKEKQQYFYWLIEKGIIVSLTSDYFFMCFFNSFTYCGNCLYKCFFLRAFAFDNA